MRYIITQKQYQNLLNEVDEPTGSEPQSGSSFVYGQQIKSTGDNSSQDFVYGKQMSSTSSASGSSSSASTTTSGFNTSIFNDKELKGQPYNYRVESINKMPNNTLEVDLGSFKIYTDCGKISKGDVSFTYGNRQLFSKDLATKVGEKFCKS